MGLCVEQGQAQQASLIAFRALQRCSLASRKVLLHVSEELQLLVLLVEDNCGISVVGEVGGPLDEGSAVIGDSFEDDLSLDAGDLMSGLSGEDLVAKGVLDIADLVDAELPLGTVCVLDGEHRVELVGAARGEGSVLDALGHNFLEL